MRHLSLVLRRFRGEARRRSAATRRLAPQDRNPSPESPAGASPTCGRRRPFPRGLPPSGGSTGVIHLESLAFLLHPEEGAASDGLPGPGAACSFPQRMGTHGSRSPRPRSPLRALTDRIGRPGAPGVTTPSVVDRRVVAVSGLSRRSSRSSAGLVAQLLTRAHRARSRTSRSTAASRPRSSRRPTTTSGSVVVLVPVVGRHRRRPDGALRLEGDPRPRHPRGDGAGALQREPHPAAHDVPEAALGGDRDRHRRARSAPRGRSSRPAARSARSSASSSHVTARRAQDAARRRRRGRHGGDLRQPGLGRAARDRAAALRVPPALDRSPSRSPRRPRPRCASRSSATAPVFAMPRSRRSRRGAALARLRRARRAGRAWPRSA